MVADIIGLVRFLGHVAAWAVGASLLALGLAFGTAD